MVAVLTNALYFKAFGPQPLLPAHGTFVRNDGSSREVDTLYTVNTHAYYRGADFSAVDLLYTGDDIALQLIVPDSGAYAKVRSELSSDALAKIASGSQPELISLTLPKFEVKSTVAAKESLQELGMVLPFAERQAEFPKLESPRFDQVFIKHVFHQATIAIDERGTEASAGTAVVTGVPVSAPPEPSVTLRVDRPFFFTIRDVPTGAVLFLGQILEP